MQLVRRYYQDDCLDRSKSAYDRGVLNQLAVLATGLGKTAIAAGLREHHGFTGRILFLVHMEQLADQAAKAMERWNPGGFVGVEMAGRFAGPMTQFVVASVPTLGRKGSDRIQRFAPDEFDAVIQDEAHIGIADSFKRVYNHFNLLDRSRSKTLFLGITATPNRSDGRGLRELFDEIVFDMGIRSGIESGFLCDIRAMRVSGNADISHVGTRGGELIETELATAVNTPERNAIVVKEWAKNAYQRRTIIFTANVQHALDIAEAFCACGVMAKAVWGEDPERYTKIAGHKAGEYDIICCAQLLGIGYDDPLVNCIVLAAPRKSFVRYAQEVGRGTRIAEGKEDLLVLDICDTASRHDLCTVSSLLGLPKDLDLRGEKFTKAKEKLDRIANEFPTANVQDIKNLAELDSMAQNIELFKVSYPPEVERLTELAWRKQGEVYTLPVGREHITISSDLLGEWWVRGKMNGTMLEMSAQNLAGAFNVADREILQGGGVKSLLARESKWRNDGPSEKQIALCRKLNLPIPNGATRGMVSSALDSHFAAKRA